MLELTEARAASVYVVVQQMGLDQRVEVLQALSPAIMAWAPDTYVIRMDVTLAYWQAMAPGHDGRAIICRVLDSVLADAPYRASMATQPWQGLLLLAVMQQRQLHGFMERETKLGESLYRAVGWEAWCDLAQALIPHLVAARRQGFCPTRFRQALTLMQRAMERLGFSGPHAVAHLTPASMKRRFGTLVHDLWLTTVQGPQASANELFAAMIPWRPYVWPEMPCVRRHLDFPVWEWDHLSVWLQQDLNRLCAHSSFPAHDRVISLEWRIVLHDMSFLVIPLSFRHPHSLHAEIPYQKTALLQAYYGFMAQQSTWQKDWQGGDAPSPHQRPIVSWDLSLQQRFRPTPAMRSLFNDEANDRQELLRLENALPIPLKAYDTRCDWVAEDAFREVDGQDKPSLLTEEAGTFPAFHPLHRCRPLFIYQEPQNLEHHSSAMWQFLERTMRKWWREGEAGERDYYGMIDQDKRALWVYQEAPGEWYVHGVFA